jgi:hypothetical protein
VSVVVVVVAAALTVAFAGEAVVAAVNGTLFVIVGRLAVNVGPQSLPEAIMNEPGWPTSHWVTLTTRRCSTVVPRSFALTTHITVAGGVDGAVEVSVVGAGNAAAACGAGCVCCACCDACAAHLSPACISKLPG